MLVYGARRPGFPLPSVPRIFVDEWLTFMLTQEIRRVVCLLPQHQLSSYNQLLDFYHQAFGVDKVCWAPIKDFHFADALTLTDLVLPFLAEAERMQEKTVVHCSGGIGRTGHVLAAWLVSFRGLSNVEAIAAVKRSGRNAQEAGNQGLDELLNICRNKFAQESI
ncbi:MAG: dual specificity protein phosphatase family protein [Trichocoleus desertorum ATA4-8-CV12]|nr:dual specificity protein phosphatase family protein [Trichocoleus desertorum ATA4-8-CV12]